MNQARNFEDVFVNVIASDHCLYKKRRLIVVPTWLVASSSTDLGGARFAHVKEEAWQSFGRRGNHLVGVCLNSSHSAKIKSMKISSGVSVGNLAKFCTSENFPLYNIKWSNFGSLWFHVLAVQLHAGEAAQHYSKSCYLASFHCLHVMSEILYFNYNISEIRYTNVLSLLW